MAANELSWALLATLLVVAALLVLVLLELRRRRNDESVVRLDARLDALAGQLGARVGDSAEATRSLTTLVGQQLAGTGRSLSELSERIGRLDQAARQVEEVGRSIRGLEQILAAPKLRGGLGEWSLEMLLAEVLPREQVSRQHRLPSRDVVVDVAVRAPGGRIVAVDSKFPLEAYRRLLEAEEQGGEGVEARRKELHRAVRGRVEEIARKYICPEDGTLDFALMYIPSESIYYELAVREEGLEFLHYSQSRRVYPCSPSTLYAYLQTIVLGLRGVRIAEHARELHAAMENMRQEADAVRELFDRAVTQMRNALQNMESAGSGMARLGARLDALDVLELGAAEE